ncbi:Choline-sulfatase [Botrimarina colliarenosi]|uniref:Choline-sulfatase n=1 Tax=Botrimarina colliarenosi TaxID=2528001 RepID=A0A5C5ZZB9_9BACT|nr:sulfatase [Botrimarina colliarenosi]TWT92922.1 Choline-sulfatase [Botrimarina colliarenosi]
MARLRFFAALAVVGLAGTAVGRPNLVLILADDCTWRDLGCYGGQAHTPHLDRFCSEGMRLTRCFQAAPMCSPTRHNLLTGLYPVRSGAYPNHTFVRDGVKSLGHYLGDLGYRVALSGKRHIAPLEAFPFEYSGGANPDFAAIDNLMSECSAGGQPLCLFVCSNEPHSPWNKGDASAYPPRSLELPPYRQDSPALRKAYSKYLAEITYFDSQVGRTLTLLEKHGLVENTVVVVLSEQGNGFPFAKWTCYDAGLRSAMMVRWPGHVKLGSESDALVEYVDVAPTFIEMAEGTLPAELEGKSLVPLLRGEVDRHKEHVFGVQTSNGIYAFDGLYGRRSVRSERYHLIHNLGPSARFDNGISKTRYFADWRRAAEAGDDDAAAIIERFHQPPEFELFDTDEDPYELRNLADDPGQAERLAELRERLAAWMESQGDEGPATEAAALSRMLNGNPAARAAARARN